MVKYQLRSYVCRELIREDFLEKLKYIDEDIQISTMRLSDMPRSKGLPSSSVEREFERRETIRDKVNAEIAEFNKSCEQMARALLTLSDLEYTVVTRLYLTLDYDDVELAESLAISVGQVQKIKNHALHKLYGRLNSQERRRKLERERSPVPEPAAVLSH